MTAEPVARQFVFDSYADLYDRSRPGYPAAMLNDLRVDGILRPEADVLEVGSGPGQLTAAVAPLVASVTALEPGDHLARLAERRVEGKGNVTVVRSTFERWAAPPNRRFDAIVAGTSFHWLERATRFFRCAALLRPGGAIAACWNMWHFSGGNPLEPFDWWSRKGDAEVDVVAYRQDRYLLLGSCRWRDREVDEKVLDQLYAHRAMLGARAARARLALFARRIHHGGA